MSVGRFVLTTVGISVLLNSLSSDEAEWRRRLNRETNAQQLSEEVSQKVEELVRRALTTLHQGDVETNRRLSAELNGLYGLYDNQLATSQGDMHYLIATDTAMGRKVAQEVVCTFLREQGLAVDIYIPPDLSAADPTTFSKGIKELIRWCEETIPGYQDRGYRVVFNLTGAFKSLQGYLNIVGMFYADEIVYIFETSPQLLSIPRLPLRVDVDTLREYRIELALMAQGHIYTFEQVEGIPGGLLEIDEDNTSLSDWGALIWGRVRKELLGDDLLPFPRLQYRDSFRRDFKRATSAERARLQETLARVASLLDSYNGDTSTLKQDSGLQYEVYTNKTTRDGRPIGHFRVSKSRRVSCTVEDGALRLRRYGEHSINDNP